MAQSKNFAAMLGEESEAEELLRLREANYKYIRLHHNSVQLYFCFSDNKINVFIHQFFNEL